MKQGEQRRRRAEREMRGDFVWRAGEQTVRVRARFVCVKPRDFEEFLRLQWVGERLP